MSSKLVFFTLCVIAGCSDARDDDASDASVDAAIDAPLDSTPDAPSSPNRGFDFPIGPTRAHVYQPQGFIWADVGEADWSCLGTPSPDVPASASAPITFSGRVADHQTGSAVGAAEINAWSMSPTATLGTTTSRDVDTADGVRGDFLMTMAAVPAGWTRYNFTITAPEHVSTLLYGRYYAPGTATADELIAVSQATATAFPAFVGIERDLADAWFLGSVHDCQGRRVSNAVAVLSSDPSRYVDAGGQTYYFSASTPSLPQANSRSSYGDGQFMIVDVTPGTKPYLQVYGFRTSADVFTGTLTLLAIAQVPTQADQVVLAELGPRRAAPRIESTDATPALPSVAKHLTHRR